ncbi:MAG: PcfJ domain-containing protein, partial [Planctomycetota bacterium]
LRQMHTWHKQLASDNTQIEAVWRRSGFPEFDFREGQSQSIKLWTIRELLSREALIIEGRKMNHCVASYSQRCQSSGCSIWTMEVETIGGRKKMLTIEVQNSSGRIVQARGKANRRAKPQELAILRRWTAETGLTLGVE